MSPRRTAGNCDRAFILPRTQRLKEKSPYRKKPAKSVMRNLSDIKYRIKGISQTRQITGAMETISIAKMRKALQRYNNNLMYFNRVKASIHDITRHSEGIKHKYWKPKENDRAVFIVIASDKGLAGGYNNNVLNLAWKEMRKYEQHYIFTVGQMAREFFEMKKAQIDVEFMHVTYDPSISDAMAIVDNVISLYEQDFMDEVYVVYTAMEKASSMTPKVIRLLPLSKQEIVGDEDEYEARAEEYYKELYFDPSPEDVLDTLVPQYMTGLIYGCLIQSAACEHSSRVLAMTNATKNATEIIDKLNIAYNRARQESVTNEMLEITTAAETVKGK